MNAENIQDERILLERRKIQSTAYTWMIIGLSLSIFIQQFFLHAPFPQYAAEFYLLISSGIYHVISSFEKGIDIWNPKGHGTKKIVFHTILTGITSAILLSVFSGEHHIGKLAVFVITFVVFLSTTRFVIIRLQKKKQEALDKELDDDMTE